MWGYNTTHAIETHKNFIENGIAAPLDELYEPEMYHCYF